MLKKYSFAKIQERKKKNITQMMNKEKNRNSNVNTEILNIFYIEYFFYLIIFFEIFNLFLGSLWVQFRIYSKYAYLSKSFLKKFYSKKSRDISFFPRKLNGKNSGKMVNSQFPTFQTFKISMIKINNYFL